MDEKNKKELGQTILVNLAKNNHKAHRPTLIKKLNNLSKDQLIQNFLIEMDAKNEAYYFIIESGYYQQFHDYHFNNKSCRNEDNKQDSSSCGMGLLFAG